MFERKPKGRISRTAKVVGAVGLVAGLGLAAHAAESPTQNSDPVPTKAVPDKVVPSFSVKGEDGSQILASGIKQISSIETTLDNDTAAGKSDIIKTGTTVPGGDIITPVHGHPNEWELHEGPDQMPPEEAALQPGYIAGVSNNNNVASIPISKSLK
jgi:hypothetical protein